MFFTRTRFKIFVFLILVYSIFSIYPGAAIAQEKEISIHESIFPFLELTAIFGKTTGGQLSYEDNTFEIEESKVSGVILGYSINLRTTLEFRYSHENPKLIRSKANHGFTYNAYELPMDYFHLGIRRDMSSKTIIPYGYLGIGLTRQNPEIIYDRNYPFEEHISFEPSTDFSGRIEIGIRSYFGNRKDIGLRAGLEVVPIYYSATSYKYPADPLEMEGREKITWDGEILWRWAATIGMSFKFQI
ncbi:MAG: hypothetical protein KAK04_13660 [Cyclobacteriaceae bacterium]|nr:hypothetical protein [Cyclobacteriaceae bacterium]